MPERLIGEAIQEVSQLLNVPIKIGNGDKHLVFLPALLSFVIQRAFDSVSNLCEIIARSAVHTLRSELAFIYGQNSAHLRP